MTLLTYQVFKTVADIGSFNKAADVLGLTASAISHAISNMEKELGFTLLIRGKNGITLTNYGERLLPYVNAVLNSDESLQQVIADMNGLQTGRVKLGAFSSVCTSWVPEILRTFKAKYPGITVEIFQGTYDDVYYWIKNGIVDLGFLSVSSAKDIPIEPLYKDPLVCVMPKGLRKSNSPIGIDEMKQHEFVSQRECTDADIQKFMKENRFTVQSSYYVVDDLSTICLVESGLGICLMPKLIMTERSYNADFFPIEPASNRIIGIAAMNLGFMAPAVRGMYEHILSMYKEI